MAPAPDRPALRLVRDDDPDHALILRPDPASDARKGPSPRRTLRQVHDTGAPLRNARETARAVRKVESANRAAANLAPADARRIFASRVAESIEGGRAGLLPLEKRQRLLRVAQTLGIRTFDANLVIAIAQDAARRGVLGQATADPRLGYVGKAGASQAGEAEDSPPPAGSLSGRPWTVRRRRALLRAALILTLAGAILASLISWVLGRN